MTPYEENCLTLPSNAQQAIAANDQVSAFSAYGKSLNLAKSLNRPRLPLCVDELAGAAF